MSAPVNEQVKAEAAKSLLERMREKTRLVRFFRYNASAKHGVPIDDEKDINITPDENQKPEPAPEPAQNIVQIVKTDEHDKTTRERELEIELGRLRQLQTTAPTTGNSNEKGLSDKVKGILQTLAAIGAIGVAIWGGSKLGGTNTEPQKEIRKTTQPYQESPFQYLEDIGEHLP